MIEEVLVDGAEVYVCGPAPFMEVNHCAISRNWRSVRKNSLRVFRTSDGTTN